MWMKHGQGHQSRHDQDNRAGSPYLHWRSHSQAQRPVTHTPVPDLVCMNGFQEREKCVGVATWTNSMAFQQTTNVAIAEGLADYETELNA
jgi:hypothetical protein